MIGSAAFPRQSTYVQLEFKSLMPSEGRPGITDGFYDGAFLWALRYALLNSLFPWLALGTRVAVCLRREAIEKGVGLE